MGSEQKDKQDLINSDNKVNTSDKKENIDGGLTTVDNQSSIEQKSVPSSSGQTNTPFVSTPAGVLTSMYTTRLGIILSNVAVVCVLFCLSSVLSVVLSWLFWMLGLTLILVTLGIILLVIPGFWNALMSSGDVIVKVTTFLMQAWPYISITGIVCSVASIVLLALDRNQRHIGRIVFSSVVIGLIVIVMIILAVGGGRA